MQEITVRSPGRINLIGEHIDYHGGSVLPAAIQHCLTIRFRMKDGNSCHVYSKEFDTQFSFHLDQVVPSSENWQNYILGVVAQMQQRGLNLGGFDCQIEGSLPMGAGISSSAALECGIAQGLNRLFNLGLSHQEIATLSQSAEHEFVGTKCGIMDQFAVVFGKKSQFIHLDCATLDHSYIPIDLSQHEIVLLHSNVNHQLSDGAYNKRRVESEAAFRKLEQNDQEAKFLKDISLDTLKANQSNLSTVEYKRAKHVIEEQQRVLSAIDSIQQGEIEKLGQLLYQSHESLQHLYEVSCDELDFLVRSTHQFPEILGARMMGGGFGGCTLNLVQKDASKSILPQIQENYFNQFGIELTPISISIEDGVSVR